MSRPEELPELPADHTPGTQPELEADDPNEYWNQRLAALEAEIRDPLSALLRKEHRLRFAWEAGNDEGGIYFPDGALFDTPYYWALIQYLQARLCISNAGEFEATGRGILFLDSGFVRAKYSSELRHFIDYNEETQESIYSEPEKEDEDLVLFAIAPL
ncbi:hypothetical protein [Flaviaesturariibacter amylovorans]|uniref:Uncharacterized protein n=1 Tax=Flaviaesturariibacter amylovorans TaxID=1084520 RepID=A0ABP8HSV2_9BACT